MPGKMSPDMELHSLPSGHIWPAILPIPGLFLVFTWLTAFVLVTTRKSSILRHLWAPCLVYVVYQFCLRVHALVTSQFVKGILSGPATVAALQCLNLLLITNLDETDLVRGKIYSHSASVASRVFHTWELVLNFRGVDTIWQVKNVPEHPAYYHQHEAKDGKAHRVSRTRYIVREGAIIIWQYLFLNLLDIFTKKASQEEAYFFEPGSEFLYFSATREQLASRLLIGVFSWLVPSRICLNIVSRTYFLLSVLFGIYRPESCRPAFGRLHDAYTIRGFWGKFWHQSFRWPLTSVGSYISRDLLGLSRPSLTERYANIFFTFFTSGLLHLVCDAILGVPPSESGAMLFFCVAPLGIMIEDAVQELWRRATGPWKQGASVVLWQKCLGFVWTCAWMCATSPWYLFPSARAQANEKWMAPVDVLDRVDVKDAQKLLLAYGLFLFCAVGGEI
ncbi:hypothetical protein HIM_00190 [Hirsutella minnesotensis 3608]|nr:hypothetical protein HIM_00190 [Hirsutella minnesotensis 3608]